MLSSRTHTIIGLVIGLALLAAPWLFAFADISSAATNVAIGVGIFVLVSELTTTSPFSPIKLIPMSAHIMVDVLAGLFLLASPWIFNFAQTPANAWVPHVIVGALTIGYALMTSPVDERSTIARV